MAATEAEVLATRLDSARRMVAHIRDGTSDLAPEPMVNLASTYTDPARHAREREVLFARTPQFACLSTEIAAPGAFRTFDEAGPPVIVARGRDGTVRAFLKICPHRGARLVREQWGKGQPVHLLVPRLDLRHRRPADRRHRGRALRRGGA